MRKSSGRRPRLVRAPVMKELHDEIAMGMHLSYAALEVAPNRNSVEMLAQILGMVGIAIESDVRFDVERAQIHVAMQALDRMDAHAEPMASVSAELPHLLNAVVATDAILPRLDVVKLHMANMKLRSLK